MVGRCVAFTDDVTMSPIWMSFAEVLRASGSWGLEWVALQVISMIAACEQMSNQEMSTSE
jgi:hypothetical protein